MSLYLVCILVVWIGVWPYIYIYIIIYIPHDNASVKYGLEYMRSKREKDTIWERDVFYLVPCRERVLMEDPHVVQHVLLMCDNSLYAKHIAWHIFN